MTNFGLLSRAVCHANGAIVAAVSRSHLPTATQIMAATGHDESQALTQRLRIVVSVIQVVLTWLPAGRPFAPSVPRVILFGCEARQATMLH